MMERNSTLHLHIQISMYLNSVLKWHPVAFKSVCLSQVSAI